MSEFWLSRDEVRELDRRAIEGFGVPGIVLMENAGRGCAELLMRLNPARKPTVILCGPGNNGGDGFVIARHLDNHRWPVFVWLVGDSTRLAGDAKTNFQIAERSRQGLIQCEMRSGSERSIEILSAVHGDPDGWLIDALFGTGLSRPMDGFHANLVHAVNDFKIHVLAVDIPSGLDCDTGEPLGPTVRATHTATFVALKKGFTNPKSREWTGEVHVVDIGAPRVLVDEYCRRRAN